jgi:glycosyltransferase involved in cell wall biosynthesis
MRIENAAVMPLASRPLEASAGLRSRLGLEARLAIVYTGNFEHYQGLELLLASLRLFIREHPEAVLIMVGGQVKQIHHWQDEAGRAGLGEYVVFTGPVMAEDVVSYLDLADILVSPRTGHLSTPLKVYSYLQAGKPVVATRIQAHTQLLTDDIAILVDATPEAFAAGLARLSQDPDLRRVMGMKAQAFVAETCSPTSYLAKLQQAYQSIELSRPIVKQASTRDVAEGAQHPA